MQLQRIQKDNQFTKNNAGLREEMTASNQFSQSKYRWIVLALACTLMLFNGLVNNIIIPIETKLSIIYGYSKKVINSAAIASFLLFSIVNIPANHILDKKGIRFGFLLGLSLYLTGLFLTLFINQAFPFVIVGYIIFTIGQPFILNCPAKLAANWFFPQNVQFAPTKRALTTAILVGCNIVGSGFGFALPTLVVKENSQGQTAKDQVFSLYLGYAITGFLLLVLNILLLKDKPSTSPSNSTEKKQMGLKETFQTIKEDKNIWKLFAAYFLIYGSFQTFAAGANFLIKPFDFSDIVISISVVFLILFGTLGAILASLYIKKTGNYKKAIIFLTIGTSSALFAFGFGLSLFSQFKFVTVILIATLGFFLTPIVPLTYELGCELAFPVGEAQVTGLLNGASLIWAFLLDTVLTAAVGFGTRARTIVFMVILFLFIVTGSVLYYMVEINLKRKQYEARQGKEVSESAGREGQQIELSLPIKAMEMTEQSTNKSDSSNYNTLVQQNGL